MFTESQKQKKYLQELMQNSCLDYEVFKLLCISLSTLHAAITGVEEITFIIRKCLRCKQVKAQKRNCTKFYAKYKKKQTKNKKEILS